MALLDELVEAHYDTIEMALDEGTSARDWSSHIDYLQKLARVAHSALARDTRECRYQDEALPQSVRSSSTPGVNLREL